MALQEKLSRYGLSEADVLRENGHAFVPLRLRGLRSEGSACLECGFMRRADGKNAPCKGPVAVTLRGHPEVEDRA